MGFFVSRPAVLALLSLCSVPSAGATVQASPTVAALLEEVTRDALQPVVEDLSGERQATVGGQPYTFETRNAGSGEPIDKAEQYIFEQLSSYGLDGVAYFEFPAEDGAPPGRNIIGWIDGGALSDEIVVVGAHLDDMPFNGRAPGADDDASGVSATLLLARSLAGRSFDRTIRFAIFGDEENAPWMCEEIGSVGYASACRDAGDDIVAMIQADAIAYDPPESDEDIVELNIRRPSDDPEGADAAIAELWLAVIEAYELDALTPVVVDRGNNWSDHGSFWKHGYSAALLIEEELDHWNPNWHTANDTIATFDWPFYVQVTRSYLALTAHLAGIVEPAEDTGEAPRDTAQPRDSGIGDSATPEVDDTGGGGEGSRCGCSAAGTPGLLVALVVSLGIVRRRRPDWARFLASR
jgi:uncharacterized protein (TIGR03382 family)